MTASRPATKILEAYNIIAKEYEDNCDNQLKEIAKRVCMENGYDCNTMVMTFPPMYGARNSHIINFPIVPQWYLFFDDACVIKKLMDEMGGKKQE